MLKSDEEVGEEVDILDLTNGGDQVLNEALNTIDAPKQTENKQPMPTEGDKANDHGVKDEAEEKEKTTQVASSEGLQSGCESIQKL